MPDSTGTEQTPGPASGPGAPVRTYTLGTVLVVLALAALAPAIGFASYMVYRTAALERDATVRRFVEAAATLSTDIDREISRHLAVATTLGNSGFLRTG